jgi:UDP-N-acetyl-D-glucosamine dehydrogenase
MEKLRALGANVFYSDPHIPVFPKMREHHFELASVYLTPASLSACDCVLIATDHDKFDFDLIRKHAKLIVDSRGRYSASSNHIVKA